MVPASCRMQRQDADDYDYGNSYTFERPPALSQVAAGVAPETTAGQAPAAEAPQPAATPKKVRARRKVNQPTLKKDDPNRHLPPEMRDEPKGTVAAGWQADFPGEASSRRAPRRRKAAAASREVHVEVRAVPAEADFEEPAVSAPTTAPTNGKSLMAEKVLETVLLMNSLQDETHADPAPAQMPEAEPEPKPTRRSRAADPNHQLPPEMRDAPLPADMYDNSLPFGMD